ncbi:uncharacterized protein LOC143295977 [Babylonia areolata]|uniref:uncharacterized protein LOC143295977 n=1 Tax=Babylonia areolata TaxID=304850 RepID=UPI003FD4CB01
MSGVVADIQAGRCEEVERQVKGPPPLSQSQAEDGLFASCSLCCDRCAGAMLQAGARTEARDSEHYTPLMHAAQRGGVKVVKLLLEWDCQVSVAGGPQSNTALHLAAEEGYLDVCQALVGAGANLNAQNALEDTALILACLHGHLPIVRFLLHSQASLRKRGYHERTALHCAAEGGHLSVCRYLVSANADLEEEDTFGNTPLICAAEKGVAEILSLLLTHGCDVNRMSHSAATALHYAAQHGALHCCKVLLEAGAEIDAQDIRRFTPLMMSALNGHAAVVELLVEWKCNVNMASYNRRTALHLAAERGKQVCCELLLEAGAAIDAQDGVGNTPLHVAIVKGQLQVMQFLIASGADVVRRPNNGNSLMHLAAAGGSKQCCEVLMARGLDINQHNADGCTPLFCAVQNKQVKTAIFLLERGCEVDVRGIHGMTALNEAAFLGHATLVKTLLLYGADPGIADDAGTLPLWFAVDQAALEIMRLLLAANSPFLCRSSLNPSLPPCNPLQYAASKQRHLLVAWIIAVCGQGAANCLQAYLPSLEQGDSASAEWVERWREMVREPQSLLRQSRCLVRRNLTTDVALTLSDRVKEMALPQVLKKYLCLDDLSDMKTAEGASSPAS